MSQEIGCLKSSLPFVYLGAPVGANMLLKNNWKPIIDKLQTKLSNWKANTLSFGGRLTLIKSVLGNLPTYFLSLFKAPQGVIDQLEKLRRRFLWGGADGKNKIHWVDWGKVIAEKKDGGLGVGSLKAQNIALLTKWWWRLKNESEGLWAKIISSIHNLNKKPATYLVSKNMGGVWSNISKGIKSISSYNIEPCELFSIVPGTNTRILFWKDIWCGNTTLQVRFPLLYQLEAIKCCSLMDRLCANGFSWNWKSDPRDPSILAELLDFYNLFGSLNFQPSPNFGFKFNLNKEGHYVVGALRRLVDTNLNQSVGVQICWSKIIPLKIKCFVWRAALGRIPVAEELIHRGINVQNSLCTHCGRCMESVSHLLVECDFAKEVWYWMLRWCGIHNAQFNNVQETLDYATKWGTCPNRRKILHMIFYSTFWNIWISRNEKLFKQIGGTPVKVADSIISQTFEWFKHRGKWAGVWAVWGCSPFVS